jgi:hypothetical protein
LQRPLAAFGEDISEQLEYIPDTFKVIRHVRPKFSCSGCLQKLWEVDVYSAIDSRI